MIKTQAAPRPLANSKAKLWTGRILWALAVPFLALDTAIHLIAPKPVVDAMSQMGWDPRLAPVLGVIQLACLALYLIPRTAVLGAVLWTGYLGGAVAAHLQSGTPFWFAILMGVLLWGSLYCRDRRVQCLINPQEK